MRDWITDENFPRLVIIVQTHAIGCALRVALTSNQDHICNCNGKLNVYGEPKFRTIEEVRRAIG